MKIFVVVDMEGISGICRSSQVMPDGEHYAASRKYIVWDTNACVAGCIAGGATRVVVRDAHATGYNFLWEDLDPRAEYIQGRSLRQRIPDLDDFDGLILLGYHAMAGTREAILEHTMSSRGWQNFWINGVKAGEFALDAATAGDHNVPTIMVSGDDKLCAEARKLVKNIVAVEVKKGLDVEGGLLQPKETAHRLITEGAARAVRECKRIKPYKVKGPVHLRLEMVSRGVVSPRKPGVKFAGDSRTYEVTGPDVETAFNML